MLNALGVGGQATGDLQHDTDLIEKNMAQLNMATPGTTDAARALVHAGRPNSGMAETSITDAADQVASQIKSNMAVRNFLTPYKFGNNGQGDAAGYQNARQTIEGVADPRAWQYQAIPAGQKGPANSGLTARQAFLQKLNPADRDALIKNTGTLESMGVLK